MNLLEGAHRTLKVIFYDLHEPFACIFQNFSGGEDHLCLIYG